MHVLHHRFVNTWLTLALATGTVSAEERPAAPPLPVSVVAERAVEFARRDAERLAEKLAALRASVSAATAKAAAGEKQVAAAKQAVAAAAQQLAAVDAEMQSATNAKAAAADALKTAQAELTKYNSELAAAEKQRAAAEQALKQSADNIVAAKTSLKEGVAKFDGDAAADLELLSAELAKSTQELVQHVEAHKSAAANAKQATTGETAAREAVDAGKKQLAAATETAAKAEAALARLATTREQAAAAKTQAENQLQAATAALEPLQTAAAEAAQQAAPLEQAVKIAEERAQMLAAAPPEFKPTALREIKVFKHSRALYSCRVDGSGRFVFAGAFGNDVPRWDLYDETRSDLVGHTSWVRRMTFDPSGHTLLTAGYEGTLNWWDSQQSPPELLRSIAAHSGFVRGVAVHPEGHLIATGGNDNLVKLWNAADGTLVRELSGHDRNIYNVQFSRDGRELVSGDLMGHLHVWNVETGEKVRTLEAPELSKYDTTFRADCGGTRGMDFSPDGTRLAVSGISNVSNAFAGVGEPTVVVFDWKSGAKLKVLKQAKFRGACWGVKWHPSGEYLVGAGGGSGGALWFWKPDTEAPVHEFKLPNVGYDLDFHPDGLRVAVALYDKTLRIYDLAPQTPTELALAQAAKKKK